MKTTPAIKVVLVLALGIYLGDQWNLIYPLLLWCLAIFVLVFSFFGLKKVWSSAGVYCVLFLVGFLLGNLSSPRTILSGNPPTDPVFLAGKVIKTAYKSDDRQVTVFRPDWIIEEETHPRPFSGNIRLISTQREVQPGSRLVLYGTVKPYSSRRNPGARDYKTEFARRGIIGWIRPMGISLVEMVKPNSFFMARTSLTQTIHNILPPRQAGLLTGMLLGDKTALPEDAKNHFQRSGLYHLLAVSGLHVGYLFALLLLLISPISLSLRLRRLILFVILWGYVFLTGANPPTVRAALMISLLLLSFEVHRIPRPWNVWGAAALIILLVMPQQLFMPGFQLSFSAMAGVLLAMDVRKRKEFNLPDYPLRSGKIRKSLDKYLAAPLLVSFCVVAFTAPILVAHFGSFTPVAILLNLAAIPLAGAIFGLAWVVILMKLFIGITIPALAGALELGLKSLENIAFVGSSLPGNTDNMFGGIFVAVVFPIILLGTLLDRNWKHRIIWISGGFVFLLLVPFINVSSNLSIESLDVGQGDATLLRFPGEKNLLVDCGNENATRFQLVPSFQHRGINRIHTLLITHFDEDHAGGAVEIMNSLKVNQLLVNSLNPDNSLGRRIIETAQRRGISTRSLSLGDTIYGFPGAKCLVLWPPETQGTEENSQSIVLKVTYGSTDILLTGDIGHAEERIIFSAGDFLDCEVLKVAHHGSRYSSDRVFLRKVQPDIALISCGMNNPHGHPTEEVLSDLKDIGSIVHRTDVQDAGVFSSNGKSVWQVAWQ